MTATDTLRALLTDTWQPAVELQRRMESAGFSVDQVRGAKRRLGVSRDSGAVMRRDDCWWWRLPTGQCPTCGKPWQGSWALELEGHGGDYWAGTGPSSPEMADDEPVEPLELQPSSPAFTAAQVSQLDPNAPLVCNVCGKPSAMDRGTQCPWQTVAGQRCPGVMG